MRKFEDVDIIGSLRKIMSNNTMFYQTDFEYDVETLQQAAAGSHFLWMSRDCGTYLFDEHDTHIRDTYAYYTWQYYTDTQYYRVKSFAVKVLENENGQPFGNIYELNYNLHREEVRKNSFPPKSVDITFKPTHLRAGYTRGFEAGEYNNNWLGIINRYGEAENVRHILNGEDENRLNKILDDFRARRETDAVPATVDSYVAEMVKEHFHGYGYTRNDMVFTTPEDASIALKHLIPVYILNPDNTAQKAQSTADVTNAVYNRRLLGMDSQGKRLLSFFKAGNTLADLPFSRSELKTIHFMAIANGKENIEDEQQRKAVDGIVKALDMILFSDDSRSPAE